MTEQRRKQITGGAFDRARNLPERDLEKATRQQNGERSDAALAALDKPEFADGKPLMIGRATATKVGLTLPKDLTSEEFRDIGTHIFTLEGITQWMIGDYIIYSARWGDIVGGIAEHFGRDPDTLYNVASIVRKFETSRRREVLTFAHHADVAAKPVEKQEEYLNIAAAQKMNVKVLRAYIREQEKDPNAKDDPPPYEPVGTEYRQMRGKINRLLRLKPTPKRRAEIAKLVETANARLAEEAAWLKGVQELLTRSAGDKAKAGEA